MSRARSSARLVMPRIVGVSATVLALAGVPGFADAPQQTAAPAQAASSSPADSIHVWPVRDGVFMLIGPGGNSTVQIGRDGVLVVDPQTAGSATAVVAALRQLSDSPVRFVIDTTPDPDHTGGNEAVASAGQSTFAGARPDVVPTTNGAPIYAHEKLLNRLVAAGAPTNAWPTFTYFGRHRDLFVNGEAVQLFYARAAHTDGDTIVMFRKSDVISAGDVFTPDRFPVIDLSAGGSIGGLLEAINFILDLAVPALDQEGGTLIVPGHGRLCDEADLSDYREMVTIVRDRVQDLIKKGKTLEQVKSAGLTRDYDGVYATERYTGEMFVEAVYRSLSESAKSTRR